MEKTLLHGDNQQERLLIKIAWLVGILEGEGCIGICNNVSGKYRVHSPRISITNSDVRLLDGCVAILKDLGLAYHIGAKTKQREQRTCWNITIMGHKRVRRFIEVILPFMIGEKKRQAELILEFTNSRIKTKSNTNKKAYTNYELGLLEELKEFKSNILRDHTPTFQFGNKIWSELVGDYKRLAEMTSPVA